MLRQVADTVRVVWVCSFLWAWGASALAQADRAEASVQYQAVVMQVLEARVQADVAIEGNQVRLRTAPSRLVKALRDVVRASAPYYFEGSFGAFKRFRPRVSEALEALDGMAIPPAPRGWEEGDWRYYQVERALQDALLLVALDIGLFADEALAAGVGIRSDLDRDWRDLRGGEDPLDIEPLPDFGERAQDQSSLGGLGGDTGQNAAPRGGDLQGIEDALRALVERVDALERTAQRPSFPPTGIGSGGGGFPRPGPDGGWEPAAGGTGVPGGPLPERFTLRFPEGSAALGLSAEYGLNTLIEWMAGRDNLRVLVTGHSDATGDERTNMELSRRRAQVVRYYLMERGVAPERVTAAHFGEQRPEWGGAFDRRVEVQLIWD